MSGEEEEEEKDEEKIEEEEEKEEEEVLVMDSFKTCRQEQAAYTEKDKCL